MAPKAVSKTISRKRPKSQQENASKEKAAKPRSAAQKRTEQPQEALTEEPRKRRRTQPTQGLEPIPERHPEGGKIYVCGQGDFGQLGLDNFLGGDDDAEIKTPRLSPLGPAGTTEVRQVAAGGMHSVALTKEGEVFTTGVNDEAALGRKTDSEPWNGSDPAVRATDSQIWGKVAIPLTHGRIVEISAGDSHTAALSEMGALWAWGCFRGSSGAFGFVPGVKYGLQPMAVYIPQTAKEQVLTISSGADHVLALRRDGSVLSWGYGEQGQLGRLGPRITSPERAMLQPSIVPLHRIQGVSSRRKFEATGIAAAAYGSFILSSTGKAVAFGVNASGQLGLDVTGNTVDQNVVHRPTLVKSFAENEAKLLGAGKAHSLLLTQQGSLLSFGLQTYGRLGRSDANANSDAPLMPGPVDGLDNEDIVSIAAGPDTSAAVTANGEAFLWGMGNNYQLGKSSENDALVPRRLNLQQSGIQKVLQISFGGQHTLILAQPLDS